MDDFGSTTVNWVSIKANLLSTIADMGSIIVDAEVGIDHCLFGGDCC